jgi:UDPglucose 6-dehydrogenase
MVTGYDLDRNKVDAINAGKAPIDEPGLAEAIEAAGPRLTATTDPYEATAGSDACIFVAPTPSLGDGSFDNSYLLDGIQKIAGAVNNQDYIFIIASTVTPGSCEHVLLPAIRYLCPQGHIVYKPELIALGTVLRDLADPDTAIFGGNDKGAVKAVFELYCGVLKNAMVCIKDGKSVGPGSRAVTNPKNGSWSLSLVEAELAKIALNCAITMKISFANQISMVATQLGANPHHILKVVGSDSRIGPKALRPGMPFGGPCFPRDCRMFQSTAERVGVTPHLALATDKVNGDILDYIYLSVPAEGSIGILGLSYKAGTSFTEDAAGMLLRQRLKATGRIVRAHDPRVAMDELKDVLASKIVIVTTDEPEYRELRFGPDTFLIDPMAITAKTRETYKV